MTGTRSAQLPSESGRIPLRYALAVFAGNGLEFYDFLTYAFFAVYIGKTFFPSQHTGVSLLASLATFGVGFVTRPIGALFFGPLGDRIGRKAVMLITFPMMGVGIVGLCITPSHAQIGIAAPILAVTFRLIQGFALGGEVGPSTAYMVEAAPPRRRGLFGSMQAFTVDASSTIAGVVGFCLALALSGRQLQEWGWRVAMGLGVVIIPFGLWIRSRLPETLGGQNNVSTEPAAAHGTGRFDQRIRPHARLILLGLMLIGGLTVGGFTVNYMATYALSDLHLSGAIAYGSVIVTGLFSMAGDVTGGWLSDRFGRKPVTRTPLVLLAILTLPAFWAIDHYHTALVLYGAAGLMTFLFCVGAAPSFTMVTEQLPMHVRSGGFSIIYAFAVSILGGSTQFAETWLIRITGSQLAPAFYWIGATCLSVFAVMLMRESAPLKLRNPKAMDTDTDLAYSIPDDT